MSNRIFSIIFEGLRRELRLALLRDRMQWRVARYPGYTQTTWLWFEITWGDA